MENRNRKAAIYCRVAYADDCAIKVQRDSLRRFAAASGFTDCAEYLDNGVSGLTLDRLALNRLNDAMANEEVQIVFVKDAPRIARNIPAAFSWLNFAESLGVEIVFQTGDPRDPGELRVLIYELLKEYRPRKRKT